MSEPSAPNDQVLEHLIGEQLSSVIFVQNYLQLDFDGLRLTIHVWPSITKKTQYIVKNEFGYRDELCSFIGHIVTGVDERETSLVIRFASGDIAIDLTADAPAERVVFENTMTNAWAWW